MIYHHGTRYCSQMSLQYFKNWGLVWFGCMTICPLAASELLHASVTQSQFIRLSTRNVSGLNHFGGAALLQLHSYPMYPTVSSPLQNSLPHTCIPIISHCYRTTCTNMHTQPNTYTNAYAPMSTIYTSRYQIPHICRFALVHISS